MKHPRASKTASILPPSLQHQLNMYALAASAAGVSCWPWRNRPKPRSFTRRPTRSLARMAFTSLISIMTEPSIFSSSSQYALRAQEALGNAVQGSVGYRWHLRGPE